MMHAQALRLHCGGPIGLRQALGLAQADEHAMVGVAHERHGSLTELPWDLIVQAITSWQPYRRRKPVEP